MSNQDQDLELETVEIEHFIKLGEALDRLKNNEDFKTLVLDGYLGQNVKDSVSMLAVPAIKKRGERGDIMEDLVAASNLQYYFMYVDQMHQAAKDPVLSDAEEAELAAEQELDNGAH